MYLKHLYTLKQGDIVKYFDNNSKHREITFIKNTGMVRAIVGQDYCLQQQFFDELGAIVHVPVNAWKFLTRTPIVRRKI